MQLLLSALQALPEYKALLSALDAGACPAAVSGLAGVHRAYFAAAAHRDTGRPVVLLCADDAECQRLAEDMGALTGESCATLPAREFTFHNAAVVSRQWEHRRLETLWELSQEKVPILIASAEAVCQRTMPRELLER